MKSRAFGKLYTYAADEALNFEGVTLNALRLFVWSMRHAIDGDRLQGREWELLAEWLNENGVPSLDGKGVQVTQFSIAQASEIFNWSKTEAARQVGRLCDIGLLEKVGNPSRGHPQMFVVCPHLVLI